MSKSTKAKSRQLSKADLKAYEARRVAQAAPAPATDDSAPAVIQESHAKRVYLTKEQEYAFIRADLKRLMMILVLLTVVLIAMTVILR